MELRVRKPILITSSEERNVCLEAPSCSQELRLSHLTVSAALPEVGAQEMLIQFANHEVSLSHTLLRMMIF